MSEDFGYIKNSLFDSTSVKLRMLSSPGGLNEIRNVASLICEAYSHGKKVIIFGNGGSAADAQHFAAELVGWYEDKSRKPFAAIALTTDSSALTAIANDAGYDHVFARQVYALGKTGDVAVGISTSGNSPNVVKGIEAAKENSLRTVAFTGAKHSRLSELADYTLQVPSDSTPRIQEAHICLVHIICGLVEKNFSGK